MFSVVWRGGALISCVDQFHSLPPLGWKPCQGSIYKPLEANFHPLWFLSWCKKALGDLAKGGVKLFTLRCSDNMVW